MPDTSTRTYFSDAGRHVYGLGAMAIGLVGLVWGDFADIWQPIQAFGNVPHRKGLAYLVAICLLAAGAALQWGRTARVGAQVVAALNFIFAVFWLPRVIGFPQIYGTWGGFFEALAPATAGVILSATLLPEISTGASTIAQAARYVFGICVVSFAIVHFIYIPQTAAMVPKWTPPGQTFWAVATGCFHLMAGLAILSGVIPVLACRLLTLMLIVFGALVWLPQPFAHIHDHTAWAGNAVNLALVGTAWVFADWFAKTQATANKQS